ncbi:hypothetical protein HZA98_03895 [Candidatus Woesearchaeota archaeon]|nr:hypothetical protein [Candidatus Woesearchaeota archaeon]
MVAKKRAVMRSSSSNGGSRVLWGALLLVLKVLGIAFIVQGFILQLSTGLLYYGMLHYTIGVLIMMGSWAVHKKRGDTMWR